MVKTTKMNELEIKIQLDKSWEIMQFDTQSAFDIIHCVLSSSSVTKEIKAECELHLGWCFVYQGEPEVAAQHFLESTSLYSAIHNKPKMIRCFNGLGVSYMEQSLYQSAIESLTQALQLFTSVDELALEIPILLNIATIYLELDNSKAALITLEQVRTIFEDKSIKAEITNDNLSLFHSCMAEALQATNELDKAEQHLTTSKQLAEISQCSLIIFLSDLGTVRQYKLKNELPSALAAYEQLLKRFNRSTAGVSYHIAQYEYAHTFFLLNQFDDAIGRLNAMINSFTHNRKSTIIIKAQELLSHCYAKNGLFEKAFTTLKKVSIDKEWLDGEEAQQQLELFKQKNRIDDLKQKVDSEREMRLELQTLHNRFLLIEKLGQDLASSLDMTVVISKLYTAVSEVMNVSALCLGIHNPLKNGLDFDYAIEFDEQLSPYHIPLIEAISFNARCFIQQETVLIGRDEILTTSDLEIGDIRMHSAIFIPISMNDSPIGVLTLQSIDANVFDPQLVSLLQGITNYLTIAVTNSLSHNKIIELHDSLQDEKDEIEYLALHDGLTQLPNRRMLLEHVNTMIQYSVDNNTYFHMLYLDLNGFKQVNDQFGHSVGDKLLIALSDRMKAYFNHIGMFSRIGGDEFVFIIPNSISPDGIDPLITHISKVIETPFDLNDQQLRISSSIGRAQFPQDGTSFDTLLHVADLAMYKVKKSTQ